MEKLVLIKVGGKIVEEENTLRQLLKDFAASYRIGVEDIMNDALAVSLEAFAEHWGQKLLNAMRALHALRYSEEFDSYEEE